MAKRGVPKETIINTDTIERLTAGISVDIVFVKNSKCTDDNVILALIIKHKLLEYKCSGVGCTIVLEWCGKPVKLLVHRKNSKNSDLQIANLDLLCPNCYSQVYGDSAILQQVIKQKIICCKICGYDKVHMLAECYRRVGFCQMCFKKLQAKRESASTALKTDMILMKSIESANAGMAVEVSPAMEESILSNYRNVPTNMADVALFMGSTAHEGKAISARVRKSGGTSRASRTHATPATGATISVNTLESIDLQNLNA
jgi:hypothetical protein